MRLLMVVFWLEKSAEIFFFIEKVIWLLVQPIDGKGTDMQRYLIEEKTLHKTSDHHMNKNFG